MASNRPTGVPPDPSPDGPVSRDRLRKLGVFSELKRRKVYRVGAAYLAGAFAALEGADMVFPVLGFGPAAFNGLVILSLAGFPLAVALAWTFDVTPEGIRRTEPLGDPGATSQVEDRWLRLRAALVGAGFVLVLWLGVRAWQPLGSAAGAALPGDPMLAVLPFEDLSSGGDQAYFADGLHEEVLHQLAEVPGIRLMSRTSVLSFRDTPLPVRVIADSLDADYILEGSLRTAGDRVNLTVQLIDGATDEHLWSESLQRSRTVEGLFDLQTTLARRVAGALGATLGAGQRDGGGPPTVSMAAYHAYLQGLHHLGVFDIDDLWAAVEDFRRAVQLDPEFGQAHARLALTLSMSNNYGQRTQGELFPEIREHALAARRLIPEDPQAHMAMLAVHWPIDWNWTAAREDLERALELNPDMVDALWALAEWEGVIAGNTDRGLELLRRAETLEPNSPRIMAMRMWLLMNARRWEDAADEARKILELDPTNANTTANLATCLSLVGRQEEARALLLGLLDRLPRPYAPEMAGHAARAGEVELAREIVRTGIALKESGGDVPASGIAIGLSVLGEVEASLDWLERSFAEEGGIYYLRHADWDNVASHPRFQALWERVGLAGLQSSLVPDPVSP